MMLLLEDVLQPVQSFWIINKTTVTFDATQVIQSCSGRIQFVATIANTFQNIRFKDVVILNLEQISGTVSVPIHRRMNV